jgi:hypothetical protein
MTSNCFRAICNFSLTRRASSTYPACSHVASKSCKPAMRSTFFLIRSNRSVSRFRVDFTSPERHDSGHCDNLAFVSTEPTSRARRRMLLLMFSFLLARTRFGESVAEAFCSQLKPSWCIALTAFCQSWPESCAR